MKALIVIESCILAWTAGTTWAQGPGSPDTTGPWSAPPTRVREIGLYTCPNHLDIQATWPARCPICNAVLNQMQPAASTTAIADRDDRERHEREEARERARRDEESREHFRRYGYRYYPPYGYSAPYTYAYPAPGYYYYPNLGYYYNPNLGYYYYPSSGYYYNPNTGQYYYYNPSTGQYYLVNPGYYGY